MKGYVARKGDRWYAVIYHGVDPDTGRERRQWVPAGTDRTKAEAIAARLGREETERRNGHRSELTRSRRISRPNSSEDVLGLPAQLSQIRELGEDLDHGISLRPGPAFRRRRRRRQSMLALEQKRWTRSFPRIRLAPASTLLGLVVIEDGPPTFDQL